MAEIQSREEAGRQLAAVLGELNIYGATEARGELVALLARPAPLELDLGGVSDFDSSGVQILLMLKREAQRLGRQLTFVNHSPSVREVLDLLNLVAELGDPLVIPLDSTGGRP
jgi:anti-anti-sigma factor